MPISLVMPIFMCIHDMRQPVCARPARRAPSTMKPHFERLFVGLEGGFAEGSRLHFLWRRWGPHLRSSHQATGVRPCIARATRARALYSNSSRPTTKPSNPCGKSVSSASTVSGKVAGIAPSPPISIVDYLNRASPSFGARSVRPSTTLLFPVVVAGFVLRAGLSRRHLLRDARAPDPRRAAPRAMGFLDPQNVASLLSLQARASRRPREARLLDRPRDDGGCF